MAKIHGITITTDTVVAGASVKAGAELFVPDDISEDNAKILLRMNNRATEIPAPKQEPAKQADPNAELLNLLDEDIPAITAALQARDDKGRPVIRNKQIEVLHKAESDGNTRVGVMDAIKAELEARGSGPSHGLLKKFFG